MLPAIVVALLVAIDQLTKQLAVQYLKGKDPFVIWDGVFELRYLENSGAAFGIFQNQMAVFFILTIVICIFLIWFYIKVPDTHRYLAIKIPVLFCIAGAIGNFIDRLLHGYVVDFFYFKLIDFPIFNVADSYITCSIAFFLLVYLFVYKEEDFDFLQKKETKAKANETKVEIAQTDQQNVRDEEIETEPVRQDVPDKEAESVHQVAESVLQDAESTCPNEETTEAEPIQSSEEFSKKEDKMLHES